MQNKIFIIAGEESGDFYGAEICLNILKKDSSAQVAGIGGKKMKEAGVNLIEDIENLSVVGLVEVIKHLPYIYNVLKKTKKFLKKFQPNCVILIDFPDFNFKIAKFAKSINLKVYYYISPQIWAWRRGRVNFIKKFIDKMYVIFPFETKFYSNYGINVKFTGHPLANKIKKFIEGSNQIKTENNTIGILPGSRKGEIKKHLPVMVKAAEMIKKIYPETTFLLPVAKNIEIDFIKNFVSQYNYIKILKEKNYYVMKKSKFLICSSGTASLECALFGKPVIIIYKVNFISYILGRLLIKVPYIGMPNLLLGEMVNPELIQNLCNPYSIFIESLKLIKNFLKYQKIVEKNSKLLNVLYRKNCFDFVEEILE